MVTVAVLAERGVFVAFLGQSPMRARPEGGDGAVIIVVAFTALYGFESGGVGPRLDTVKIFMAGEAV